MLVNHNTQLGTATKYVKTTIENLNDDFVSISDWMAVNKLSLSKSKAEYIHIGSHQKLKQCNSDEQRRIGDTAIQRVIATKSLGIMVDETLNWHSHTYLIKVNKGLQVLKQLRDLMYMGSLVTVYKTFIQPRFDYCPQVWGCLGITLQNHLQRLQNRSVRIITKCGYEFRSADILKRLDLFTQVSEEITIMYYYASGIYTSHESDTCINSGFFPSPSLSSSLFSVIVRSLTI